MSRLFRATAGELHYVPFGKIFKLSKHIYGHSIRHGPWEVAYRFTDIKAEKQQYTFYSEGRSQDERVKEVTFIHLIRSFDC